jgi:hypothetical protein
MKWIVKVIIEAAPGDIVEHEIVTLDRPDSLCPATVGLSIVEGKALLENLQTQLVAARVRRHNVRRRSCSRCGKAFRTKGYYQSTLRSVYGNVPMRVRRLRGCSCTGTQDRSYSTIFTNNNPITPELRYLNAKMGRFPALWQSR